MLSLSAGPFLTLGQGFILHITPIPFASHYLDIPGAEVNTDLVLLCEPCRAIDHTSIDNFPSCRRTVRRMAT